MTKTPNQSLPTQLGGPTQPPGADAYVGQVFGGKYRIISEISRGGMGRIFKAEQISLNRSVAIKIVTATNDQNAAQRFLLEASLTANLDHPNIVQIFDFGKTPEGVLFLVMELLSGENLQDWVKNHGPLSIKDALQVTQQLCGALAEAHGKNVIHRDIKPSNVVVQQRPGAGMTAKLIDFGLVKSVDQNHGMSRTGMLLGTPMFMAPEQITASGVDDRVDIYALGLTLFYALTGEFPYPDRGLNALIHAQLNEDLRDLHEVNPKIDDDHMIAWIVRSAVAKDPDHRFQNTLQMLETLQLCRGCLDANEFPTVQITDGVLSSDSEVVQFNPEIPSKPLVDSASYVKDGSALSKNYAQTLYMSGVLDRSGETFMVSSGTSLNMNGETTESIPEPESKGPNKTLLAIFVIGAVIIGLILALRPEATAPVTTKQLVLRDTVEVKSVPDGADVLRDGVFLGSTPFSMLIESGGTATIELRLKGYTARKLEVSSDRPSVTVRLRQSKVTTPTEPTQPAAAPAKAPAKAPATPAGTPRRATPRQPAKQPAKQKAKQAAKGPRDPWAD